MNSIKINLKGKNEIKTLTWMLFSLSTIVNIDLVNYGLNC
jgi:hypothetical protein